jgi:hypothetical protein
MQREGRGNEANTVPAPLAGGTELNLKRTQISAILTGDVMSYCTALFGVLINEGVTWNCVRKRAVQAVKTRDPVKCKVLMVATFYSNLIFSL